MTKVFRLIEHVPVEGVAIIDARPGCKARDITIVAHSFEIEFFLGTPCGAGHSACASAKATWEEIEGGIIEYKFRFEPHVVYERLSHHVKWLVDNSEKLQALLT